MLNTHVPHDLTGSLVDIFLGVMATHIHKRSCVQMFIANLFLVATNSMCIIRWMNEEEKTERYSYTRILLRHKKVIWMDVKKNSIEQNEPASTE